MLILGENGVVKMNSLAYTPNGSGTIKLVSDYQFNLTDDNSVVTIPTGFVSDGSTIPRLLWPIFGSPFSPKLIHASIEHDFLISENYDGETRDLHFYSRLLKSGVLKWKAYLMYLGVVVWRKTKNLLDK